MSTEDIQRQLAALDAEFDSAENRRTGKLDLQRYQRRHSELLKRLRKAEQEDHEAGHVAQAQRTAPSARHFVMPTTDAKQLKEFGRDLKAAIESGNAGAALEILQSKDFLKLLYLDERADAADVSDGAYAALVGARSTLAMKYITLAGMQRRALEDRVKALESAIPQYRGTFKSGATYDKNSIITDRGSMWIALKETDTRPPGESWQQCTRGVR